MTKKCLSELPVKLRELFLELRSYNYYTTHIAGARNIISDALCRSVRWAKKKVCGPEDKEEEGNEEVLDYEASGGIERAFARQVTAADNNLSYVWKDPMMDIIINQVSKDEHYKKVAKLIQERRNKDHLKSKLSKDHPARAYLNKWDELGTETDPTSGTILMTLGHSRLVIPQGVQEDDESKPGNRRKLICKKLHTAHLGETKS